MSVIGRLEVLEANMVSGRPEKAAPTSLQNFFLMVMSSTMASTIMSAPVAAPRSST